MVSLLVEPNPAFKPTGLADPSNAGGGDTQMRVSGRPPVSDHGAMSAKKPIRVLIADDDPAVRLTLARWCSYQPDMKIVGEASNGEEALALAEQVPVDVIVMDVRMPKMTGLEATKRIRRLGIETPVLIFSAEEKAAAKIAGLGNVRFLSKASASSKDTLSAIRTAARSA